MSKGKGARGGPQGMMGRLQQMQEQLLQAQAELAEETVEATAGELLRDLDYV